MTIAHLLVDFANFHSTGEEPVFTDATLEEHQLEAFEQGYQAGWEDSAKAHAEEGLRMSEELAAAFQGWSFTFSDAQTQLLSSLKPLFQQISETLLPALAQTGAPNLLSEQLLTLSRQNMGETIQLHVSPNEFPAIERHLQNAESFSVELTSDPSIKPGEFQISVGAEEHFIDINQVISSVQDALAAMTTHLERTGTYES
jgi:flagellar assembly protein FliH